MTTEQRNTEEKGKGPERDRQEKGGKQGGGQGGREQSEKDRGGQQGGRKS